MTHTESTPEQKQKRPAPQLIYDLLHTIETRREICMNCFSWRSVGRIADDDDQPYKRLDGHSVQGYFGSSSETDWFCSTCGAGTKQEMTVRRSWNDGGEDLPFKGGTVSFQSVLDELLTRLVECGIKLDRSTAFTTGCTLKKKPEMQGRDLDCLAGAVWAGMIDAPPFDLDVPFAPPSLHTRTSDDSPVEQAGAD